MVNAATELLEKSGLGSSVNAINCLGKNFGTNAFKEMTNATKPMTFKFNNGAMKSAATGKQSSTYPVTF